MPVIIEQPSPMAPDITAGGGAAQVTMHDLPTLAGMYEAIGRNAASMGAASIGAQAHMAAAHIGAVTQADIAGAAQEERRREFDAEREPSARDQFMAEQQSRMQDQRTANAAWLNQQEMSQQEVMQLARDRNTIGFLSNAVANGSMTEDEFNDRVGALRPRIDVAQARMDAQRQRQQQQAMQAHAQGTAAEDAADVHGSQTAANSTFTMNDGAGNTVIDEATGQPARYYKNRKTGKIEMLPTPQANIEAMKEQKSQLAEERKAQADDAKEYRAIYAQAAKEATEIAKASGEPLTGEKVQKYRQDLLGGYGMPGTLKEYIDQRKAERAQDHPQRFINREPGLAQQPSAAEFARAQIPSDQQPKPPAPPTPEQEQRILALTEKRIKELESQQPLSTGDRIYKGFGLMRRSLVGF